MPLTRLLLHLTASYSSGLLWSLYGMAIPAQPIEQMKRSALDLFRAGLHTDPSVRRRRNDVLFRPPYYYSKAPCC